MRTRNNISLSLVAGMIGLASAMVFTHNVTAKCQADPNECTMHEISGGTPAACGAHTETWSHGSCNPRFTNYQCDDKCEANMVQKTNIRHFFAPVYDGNTVVDCRMTTDDSNEVSINCAHNVSCDNPADCPEEPQAPTE